MFFFLAQMGVPSPVPSGEAAVTLPLTNGMLLMAFWIAGLAMVLVLINLSVSIWNGVKAKPANHEVFATKQELKEKAERSAKERAELEARLMSTIIDNRSNMHAQMGSLSGKIDSIQTGFQSFTNDVFRAIGKLEGKP